MMPEFALKTLEREEREEGNWCGKLMMAIEVPW